MKIVARRLLFSVLAALVFVASSPVASRAGEGEDESRASELAQQVGYVSVDVVLLRPLGFVRLLVGGLFLLPISSTINALALPLSRYPDGFKEDYDRYVAQPSEYLFRRPLGRELAG